MPGLAQMTAVGHMRPYSCIKISFLKRCLGKASSPAVCIPIFPTTFLECDDDVIWTTKKNKNIESKDTKSHYAPHGCWALATASAPRCSWVGEAYSAETSGTETGFRYSDQQ